jgi:hypothetical protein
MMLMEIHITSSTTTGYTIATLLLFLKKNPPARNSEAKNENAAPEESNPKNPNPQPTKRTA